MRRFLAVLSVAVLLSATPGAITFGVPDNNDHPNVGLLIVAIPQGFFALCSGVLVSPTVFLTAGHCTDAIEDLDGEAFVSFSSGPPFVIRHGTAHTHPDFDLTLPNTFDIGVVVLDNSVAGITPAAIPTEGFLDEFATRRGQHDLYFTHVGYGAQAIVPKPINQLLRMQGTSSLINLRNVFTDGFNVQTTANPGRDRSGICFGDSGGPAFFTDTDLVVAIHSFVRNQNCTGSSFSYRIDTAVSLDFLAEFGVFPQPE
jgi:hypothetical protein